MLNMLVFLISIAVSRIAQMSRFFEGLYSVHGHIQHKGTWFLVAFSTNELRAVSCEI